MFITASPNRRTFSAGGVGEALESLKEKTVDFQSAEAYNRSESS